MALALALAAAASYGVLHFLGPGAIWRRCEEAYARAESAADTAAIDRSEATPIPCGELRRERALP